MPSRFRFTCLTIANDRALRETRKPAAKTVRRDPCRHGGRGAPVRGRLRERIGRGQFDAIAAGAHQRPLAGLDVSGVSLVDGRRSVTRPPTPCSIGCVGRPTIEETRAAVNDLQNDLSRRPTGGLPDVADRGSRREHEVSVPGETGRDIMGTLWQWRPASPTP